MTEYLPRLVMAALRGGAGKTTLSLGMAAAWRKRGKKVAPFKKGPDYIDAAWLSLAAGQLCHNLDLFLMGRQEVLRSFERNTWTADIALIEGNRGLYDGMDAAGSQSTAELAKLLDAPVILILDCDKVTRTAAAMTLGCQKFDPGVDIKGVIMNRVARSRQEEILRRSIEQSCHLPVLGAVPRMENFPFPERHLGLTPPQEHVWVQKALGKAIEVAEKYLDLEQLWGIAGKASRRVPRIAGIQEKRTFPVGAGRGSGGPVIGVVKDSAFQFYYPENLQALANHGATVIEISPMREKKLPPVDALYIGGGFPEMHAQRLAANVRFRNSLRQAVENGLPVYAECGGLMYLGESLIIGGQNFPMVGALPVAFQMEKRPQGHGYTLLEVEKENPFFPVGFVLKGHEFHYSRLLWLHEGEAGLAFKVKRGAGIDGKRDGLYRKNVLATYSHVHALGTAEWGYALVEKARGYRLSEKIAMAVV